MLKSLFQSKQLLQFWVFFKNVEKQFILKLFTYKKTNQENCKTVEGCKSDSELFK